MARGTQKDNMRYGNPLSAGDYFALSEDEKSSYLNALSDQNLSSLTSKIQAAHRQALANGERRFEALKVRPARTPVYLIDTDLVEDNLRILKYVKDRTGCKILHALKAFATTGLFPIMARYLDGTCASGYHEARLGHDAFGKEVHTYAPAYREDEFAHVIAYSTTIVFNSFTQLKKFGPDVKAAGREVGLRINPGYSEVETDMYNPCAPCSRLGVIYEIFTREYPHYRDVIDGLHFHVLCEQGADVLERVLQSFTHRYGPYLKGLKWVNFGGGHHITREDYDVERLINTLNRFHKHYDLPIYLEPGEASVLNAGVLITSVLDIVKNQMDIAIIDASAEAHMPDVLLMPYRPYIIGSALPGEKRYTYRIAGPTCLAGDIIGDYSFDEPLVPGDRIVFTDMAHYSIVKTTTFNGINLPDIAVLQDGEITILRRFGYEDYKSRLG